MFTVLGQEFSLPLERNEDGAVTFCVTLCVTHLLVHTRLWMRSFCRTWWRNVVPYQDTPFDPSQSVPSSLRPCRDGSWHCPLSWHDLDSVRIVTNILNVKSISNNSWSITTWLTYGGSVPEMRLWSILFDPTLKWWKSLKNKLYSFLKLRWQH